MLHVQIISLATELASLQEWIGQISCNSFRERSTLDLGLYAVQGVVASIAAASRVFSDLDLSGFRSCVWLKLSSTIDVDPKN